MKVRDKNALEIREGTRKGSQRAQCPRSDGRVAISREGPACEKESSAWWGTPRR